MLHKPHFIGIGAQKAGTTWLYEQLKEHPHIFVTEKKELNFFYSDRPVSWYAEQFSEAPTGKIAGEVSPNYFPRPEIPQRIHELLPCVRLFCILRDPMERAFSQWKMARMLGNIPDDLPFIEAFNTNRNWIRKQGEYMTLIDCYARHFPIGEKLLVLLYDDIVAAPFALMQRLYGFLGVDEDYVSPHLNEVVAPSCDPATISEEDEACVREYYRTHNVRLEERLSRDLTRWNGGAA